ncbi:mviN-like family protein [Orientia tsutsugamushi str. Gilliam]|uniref:MviN-like family protein n=1 Tax=Orientia tsutsugamushi str. Gilliam TaxID=1359184 RepID=A0A0F3MAA0_ORITS|nr:mviN-like family protein [Orientia tsutsugamushi str. Gilliam]
MLNSVGKFAVLAFSPILLNILVIAGTYLSGNFASSKVAICCSLIIAGLIQVLFVYINLKKLALDCFLGLIGQIKI